MLRVHVFLRVQETHVFRVDREAFQEWLLKGPSRIQFSHFLIVFTDVDDKIRGDVTVEADANRSISLLSVDVGEDWDAVKYLNCGPGGIIQGLGLLAQTLILSQLILRRYLEVDGRFNPSFFDASIGLQLYSLDIFLHLMYHFFNVRRFDFRVMCSLLTSVQL